MTQINARDRKSRDHSLAVLLVAVLLIGLYTILRYRGLWGETDTSVFTSAIRAILDSERLIAAHDVYPNGYGFQALAVWLTELSGISLASLQLYVSMIFVVWLVIPAWLLYRVLLGTEKGTILATVLLFVQPEFLFPALRGTHEKFTRGLMLFALYMMARSLEASNVPRRFTAWILSFYGAIYALIAFNTLLASSFIAATLLSLFLAWFLPRLPTAHDLYPRLLLQRLRYAVLVPMVLVFLFVFYVYPPASHNLLILESIWDRMVLLFLNVEKTAANPYSAVTGAWISLPVYFVMSAANWLLLLSSACIWSIYTGRWLRGRWRPATNGILLLWVFYGAFAFLGACSILVDVSGAIAGNLQHRMFPAFVMLAAPLVAWWMTTHSPQGRWRSRPGQLALGIAVLVLAILAILKATNEPLLSNKWLFYVPSESRALDWANEHLSNRLLWTGYDERLDVATRIRMEGMPLRVQVDRFAVDPGTRNFLISKVMRARGRRLDASLPLAADRIMDPDIVTYDNGDVQIYQLRPYTPDQP